MKKATEKSLFLAGAILLTIASIIAIFNIVVGIHPIKWFDFIIFIATIILWYEYKKFE